MQRMTCAPALNRVVASAVIALLSACNSTHVPQLSSGSTWVVESTSQLDNLIIPERAVIAAPDGKHLTMTVDGVGTTIAPGAYQGKVVLTVTDDIPIKYRNLEHHYRTALYVDDGKIVPEKSVSSALVGGKVTGSAATDVSITSNEDKFNGIFITGNSKYTITNPIIQFTGNGGNDFAGYGAAIMANGQANVTVENAKIINKGVVRTAVFVGGDATVRVNNSTIETYNGTLPADYEWTIALGKMMEVPWMLGLSGNVRSTNVVENGTVYYNDSHIKTQGWGAMSADDPKKVRMYVTNSTIEALDSGYGAYSIADSHDYFIRSTLKVADIGLIIAGEGSGTFTDGTKVESGRFGVMMHSGVGGGTLTIDKGSEFNTKSTAIQVKGRGTTIVVDDAKLNPENGILLQAMENDDPYANGTIPIVMPPGVAPMGPPPGDEAASSFSPDVVATFRNVDLKGDLINARPKQGDMIINLEKAKLLGAITTAVATPVGQPSAENRRLIGEVKNTFAPSSDPKNGVQVKLDAGSSWTVAQTSYLTGLTLAEGATIDASPGKRVTLWVNGTSRTPRAGSYTGKIELRVMPAA